MAKRLIFCFDGTWNRLSADVPTNVATVAQMVRPVARSGTHQIVYYDEGIGTNTSWVNQRWQGITGKGLMNNLREAYRFLIFNHEPGDEIYAFGFSRGAFTARTFIGFIRHAGILDVVSANQIDKAIEIYRNAGKVVGNTGEESGSALRFRARHCKAICVSDEDIEFRKRIDADFDPEKAVLLNIRFLGAWDTVSALGVPQLVPGSKWINAKYGFHDAVLTSKIKAARHAVALDELRPTFRATLFGRAKVDELNARAARGRTTPFSPWEQPYQEQWFPGVHGAVGGGGAHRGLSDGALAWILTGAKRAGLELRADNDSKAFQIRPDSLDPVQNQAAKTIGQRFPIGTIRRLFHSPRAGPQSLSALALATLQRWFAPASALSEGKPYRPGALLPIAAEIENWPYARLPELKSEHIVLQGETLSLIAERYLGARTRYLEIFEANRDRLDDPDHVMPGTRLRIPFDGPAVHGPA
uniref:phospholipase effector Tle1 domain-containing protein n=1 Tax=Parerythrobacter lutipelagi TaxID=1964208 RepID=UPI0010F9DB91|nr:DUF2235 domain-containing protein [Parerythrobacter lutipelagi]